MIIFLVEITFIYRYLEYWIFCYLHIQKERLSLLTKNKMSTIHYTKVQVN